MYYVITNLLEDSTLDVCAASLLYVLHTKLTMKMLGIVFCAGKYHDPANSVGVDHGFRYALDLGWRGT